MIRDNGITLVELVVVLSILALLTIMVAPSIISFTASSGYREASQLVLQSLRKARSRAVTENIEYTVNFDFSGNSYSLKRGNRSAGSSTFTTIESADLPQTTTLRRTDDCDENSDVTIFFKPNGSTLVNGTASSESICIMEAAAPTKQRYRVSIENPKTGRVVID